MSQLLTSKQVEALTTLSRITIWRYVRAGIFPSPFKLGPKRIAWRQDEIDDWIQNRTSMTRLDPHRKALPVDTGKE